MLTVDRIVEGIAVLIEDNGSRREMSLSELPRDVKEGSVLKETANGLAVDKAVEISRRTKIAKRARSLFKKKSL